MALVLILADGTEIELADATYNKHYVINCTNDDDFSEKRSAMTNENLSEVKILEDGEEVAHLIGLTLTGVQEVLNPDNTVTAHFYFTGDKVHYPTADDDIYESVIDNNVWSPVDYPDGWKIVDG